ncbi:MAG: hypothetical protein ACR2L2_14870 [Acidobacteriota bacterium]
MRCCQRTRPSRERNQCDQYRAATVREQAIAGTDCPQRKNGEAQAEIVQVKDASLQDKDRIIALERDLRGKVEARVVQLEDQVKPAGRVTKKSWIWRAGDKLVTVAIGAAIEAVLTRK